MAGIGSGWFERRSTRPRTDEYHSINLRSISREYRLGRDVVLPGGALVALEWRPCHFGGYRPYFQCPRCNGRCCILYRFRAEEKRANSYGCQKCLCMVHPVENEGKLERAMRRSNKVFNRQTFDGMRPEGKPLWMRWPTWRRLCEQAEKNALVRFEYHERLIMLLRHFDKPIALGTRKGFK